MLGNANMLRAMGANPFVPLGYVGASTSLGQRAMPLELYGWNAFDQYATVAHPTIGWVPTRQSLMRHRDTCRNDPINPCYPITSRRRTPELQLAHTPRLASAPGDMIEQKNGDH